MTAPAVAICYKNFGANRNISHIGLGVAALNTMKVLRRANITANVWPILSCADLRTQLVKAPQNHVVIAAPWIPTADLAALAQDHTETHFTVTCHSNVGFLQADRNGVKLLREAIDLELATHNVHLAGNSKRFCEWIRSAYSAPCAYLPNLYYLDPERTVPQRHDPIGASGPLRIGVFGAVRPLKNAMTAAAAALDIARSLRLPLEFWMSSGRSEGGGDVVLASLREMLDGLPNVKLVLNGWQPWPVFRKTVAHMHLLLQPSYTETFNIVSADGVAEGIPSVVSHAIDWAPAHWKADVDDALSIARVGRQLLHDPHAAHDGLKALHQHVCEGLRAYQQYFGVFV